MDSAVAQREPLPHASDLDSLNAVVHTEADLPSAPSRPARRVRGCGSPFACPWNATVELQYVLTAVTDVEILAPLVKSHLPETEEWTRVIVDSGLHIAARSRRAERVHRTAVTPAGAELIRHPPDPPGPHPKPRRRIGVFGPQSNRSGWASSITVPLVVLDGPVRASILAIVAGSAVLLVGGLFGVLVVSGRSPATSSSHAMLPQPSLTGEPRTPSRPRVAEAQQVRGFAATGRTAPAGARPRP